VAVCATYVALSDLRKNNRPWLSDDEERDCLTFGGTIAIVELQRDDVSLAAVDTWMSPQVLANQRPILGAIALDPRDFLADVSVAVAHVVLTSVFRVTDATARLAGAL
jgi:hypothetical protein